MSRKPYVLTAEDRAAVFNTARNLQMDPYEFGAVLMQESGMDPNIWGGDGGNYYGAIQFGGPERSEAGLDPKKIGNYTLAEQMPHVEKWAKGRGYKPGMGVQKLYATILGGNPDADIDLPDSNNTTVRGSMPRFLSGGSLYTAAQKRLGDAPEGFMSLESQQPQQPGTATDNTKENLGTSITNNFLTNYILGDTSTKEKEDKPESLVEQLQKQLFNQAMGGQQQKSFAGRLLDSMKNSPYGGYLNPLNSMSTLENYYNRLF